MDTTKAMAKQDKKTRRQLSVAPLRENDVVCLRKTFLVKTVLLSIGSKNHERGCLANLFRLPPFFHPVVGGIIAFGHWCCDELYTSNTISVDEHILLNLN